MRWLWLILLLPGSILGADLDQLLAAYRKALAGNPGFLPARKNLAVVLWFAGRRSEAEGIFRQLLPQLPRDPVPHLYLGLAAHARAQHKDARDGES